MNEYVEDRMTPAQHKKLSAMVRKLEANPSRKNQLDAYDVFTQQCGMSPEEADEYINLFCEAES